MGKHAAIAVLRRGGLPWIVGRDEAKLAAAAQEISPSNPAGVRTSSVDSTNQEALQKFFGDIPAGSIHHIVTTVGPGAGANTVLGADGFALLKKQFDVKFFAQLSVVSFGAEKIADGGSIVLTSGTLARRPGKGSSALGAANAALEAIVKGLANDLGPRLRVNVVSPGLTDTEMWAGLPEEKRKAMMQHFGSSVPMGRAGTSGDVGEGIAVLLEATYTTGSTLDVDGGAGVRP